MYNCDGPRMAESRNGVTTTYVVAVLGLSQVLVETTGGESIVYLYGHDLLAEEGAAWAWHLGDGLGSVRQLVDGEGGVTLAQGYTPFGVPLWSEGSATTGYGFTGERWGAYSALLFLRARYYEPGTGRFLTRDPWPGTLQEPETLHGYVYVLNNPPNGTDPTGLLCIFGLGDCDEDPDLAAVAYYYLVQADFCLTIGDTWCWGGENQGIDPWDPANNAMFYDDMAWTWYHPAQAWGLPEESIKTLLIEDWFFEAGFERRVFDEHHPVTQILMHHEGVNNARDVFLYARHCHGANYWYNAREGKTNKIDLALIAAPAHGEVFIETLLGTPDDEKTIKGTLGSYNVVVTNNHDGTATFRVKNRTSRSSGSFELIPAVSRKETKPNWLCDEGCGGNLDQEFVWTEPILPGVCDCFSNPCPE